MVVLSLVRQAAKGAELVQRLREAEIHDAAEDKPAAVVGGRALWPALWLEIFGHKKTRPVPVCCTQMPDLSFHRQQAKVECATAADAHPTRISPPYKTLRHQRPQPARRSSNGAAP